MMSVLARARAGEADRRARSVDHTTEADRALRPSGNQAQLRGGALDRRPKPPSQLPVLRRKCACGGSIGVSRECAECRGEGEELLRRRTGGTEAPAIAPPIVHRVLRSRGQPLDQRTRAFMEPRFGRDLGAVRVHTGREAAESAYAVNAAAYTVGQHVVFGAGRYAPESAGGQRLLAHELTHVTQFGDSDADLPSRLAISDPGDAAERDADAAASAIASGGHPTIGSRSAGIVARSVVEEKPITGGEQPLPTAGLAAGTESGSSATTSVASPSSTPVAKGITKGCIAPSFVVTPAIASLFGTVAELLIEPDYIAQKGGIPFGDVFLDNPMGPLSYIAFLAAHHPHLNVALLALQIGLSGGVLVPDILDARSQELYEIKPDSPDGRLAGAAKLLAIEAFMGFNTLPYFPGLTYTPNPSIPIPLGSAALAPFLGLPTLIACGIPDVTLKTRRAGPGLLLYEICVEADFGCWLKVFAIEVLIALIILAILAGMGIPVPAPAPVPVPVPVPVPA